MKRLKLWDSLRVVALYAIDEQLPPPVDALTGHLASDSVCKCGGLGQEIVINKIDLIYQPGLSPRPIEIMWCKMRFGERA